MEALVRPPMDMVTESFRRSAQAQVRESAAVAAEPGDLTTCLIRFR